MSDTTTPTPADVAPRASSAQGEPDAKEAKAAADAARDAGDELATWKAEARKWEAQAKANAEAAKRLAELEDANKTEAEKVAERLANAEREATEAKATALRLSIALEHKLDETDAALLDKLTDEDAMRALAARLAAAQVEEKATRPPRPDPNQGRNGAAPTNTADLFAATVGDLIK